MNAKLVFPIFILFLLTSISSQGQSSDEIIKKDGTLIKGKIIQVTQAAIEIDPDGEILFQIIKRSEVALLKYANVTEVKLGELQTPNGASVRLCPI